MNFLSHALDQVTAFDFDNHLCNCYQLLEYNKLCKVKAIHITVFKNPQHLSTNSDILLVLINMCWAAGWLGVGDRPLLLLTLVTSPGVPRRHPRVSTLMGLDPLLLRVPPPSGFVMGVKGSTIWHFLQQATEKSFSIPRSPSRTPPSPVDSPPKYTMNLSSLFPFSISYHNFFARQLQ